MCNLRFKKHNRVKKIIFFIAISEALWMIMMLCLVFGPDLIKIIAECNLIKSFSWSKVNGPGGPVVPVDFYCFLNWGSALWARAWGQDQSSFSADNILYIQVVNALKLHLLYICKPLCNQPGKGAWFYTNCHMPKGAVHPEKDTCLLQGTSHHGNQEL